MSLIANNADDITPPPRMITRQAKRQPVSESRIPKPKSFNSSHDKQTLPPKETPTASSYDSRLDLEPRAGPTAATTMISQPDETWSALDVTCNLADPARPSDESSCSSSNSSTSSMSFGGRGKSAVRIKEMLESVRRRMSNSSTSKPDKKAKLEVQTEEVEENDEQPSQQSMMSQTLDLSQLEAMMAIDGSLVDSNQLTKSASLSSNVSHTMKLCDCLNNLISFSQKLKFAAEENERRLRLELGKVCLKATNSKNPIKRCAASSLARLPNYIPGRKSVGGSLAPICDKLSAKSRVKAKSPPKTVDAKMPQKAKAQPSAANSKTQAAAAGGARGLASRAASITANKPYNLRR